MPRPGRGITRTPGGLLGDRFGRRRPLRLGATLALEQSYETVEGDSASLVEALVLLSALARVPLAQGIAVTGSVDQLGHVQPVGSVCEKVEGFFDACRARGLEGRQGVAVPAANVRNLVLREDVVRAAGEGRFAVYPVRTLEEAMELLSGVPFGVPDAAGRYPPGTVGARCAAALDDLDAAWRRGRGPGTRFAPKKG